MYYELYVDVLFLVNFMMDYLLLLLVRKMLKCSATHGNICIGACLGALSTCLVIVLPIPYAFMKLVLFHIAVNTLMIRVGLKIKDIKNFIKAFLMLYSGGFLLGGILESLSQYMKIGSLFFAAMIASYYIAVGIWNFFASILRRNHSRCMVELYVGDRKYQIEGLIDTGNGLHDPLTGKPVSILDKRAAKAFLGHERAEKIRYIPYHSIGKQDGVLPAVTIDKMCVQQDLTHWIEKPLIGISEEEISAGENYKMILNPDLF